VRCSAPGAARRGAVGSSSLGGVGGVGFGFGHPCRRIARAPFQERVHIEAVLDETAPGRVALVGLKSSDDLWPWWTYPGASKIERWIPSFPLSRDQQRETRLQRQRALYRLACGQPRQEDLLTILD
jgi:hypothetical protein